LSADDFLFDVNDIMQSATEVRAPKNQQYYFRPEIRLLI